MEIAPGEMKEKAELYSATKQLVALYDLATTKCVNFVDKEEFAESYKKIFKSYSLKDGAERVLAGSSLEAEKLRERIKTQISNYNKECLEYFLEETDLDSKLRELDRLKTSSLASKDKKAWRPPGDAREHQKYFSIAQKLAEKESLKALVAKEREILNLLKVKVSEKRKKAQVLEKLIDRKHEILNAQLRNLHVDENEAMV